MTDGVPPPAALRALASPVPPQIEIHEVDDGEWVTLRVTGELDLGSAPLLEQRLAHLRAEEQPVRLDLSGLGFIDSSGLHLLIGAVTHARAEGRQFEVDPELSPQVERILRLTNLRALIWRPLADERW